MIPEPYTKMKTKTTRVAGNAGQEECRTHLSHIFDMLSNQSTGREGMPAGIHIHMTYTKPRLTLLVHLCLMHVSLKRMPRTRGKQVPAITTNMTAMCQKVPATHTSEDTNTSMQWENLYFPVCRRRSQPLNAECKMRTQSARHWRGIHTRTPMVIRVCSVDLDLPANLISLYYPLCCLTQLLISPFM